MNSRRIWIAALLGALLFPGRAISGIGNPCESQYVLHSPATPCLLLACPNGDTPPFLDHGWWIELWVRDDVGNGVPDIPATDIWMIDCDPLRDITLCGEMTSSNADSATDADGRTTVSTTTLAGGGCADGMSIIVQGFTILDSLTCTQPECGPISLRSPDLDGSLRLDLVDLSLFAAAFPPLPYDTCYDFNLDGTVDIVDLAEFAAHFGPPGHRCTG